MVFPLPSPVYSASCSFFSLSVNLSVSSQLSCFHSNDRFVVTTPKATIWLLISMLKDLLSTLKPPLHITLVVLLSSLILYLCVFLYFWHTDRGWHASKGRKSSEPTPTELTFKLHPIPPGTKGTVLNVRLNPEMCMKKSFSCVQRGSKGQWNFIKAPRPSFALTFTSLAEHESNLLQIFMASEDRCESIFCICLSLLNSCISAVLTGELLYMHS